MAQRLIESLGETLETDLRGSEQLPETLGEV